MEFNVFSRSEIETVLGCPTKAYETYRRDGHGYVPKGAGSNITALQGSGLHKGGESIFRDGLDSAWREAVSAELAGLDEPHRTIRTTLIRRALLGWSIKRYPALVKEWKPLAAELPWKWEFAPGFYQPIRMDNIFEHRENGTICIFDFKTAGSPDLNWTERKRISKQTHLYIKALKDTLPDRHIAGIMYDCIVIGKWDDKKEVHKSPFVTGYTKGGKVSPKWLAGSTLTDLIPYSDDKWLDWAQGTGALDELYWTTELLNPSDGQLERTQASTSVTVMDYAIKLQRVASSPDPEPLAKELFDRNPDQCLAYGWGLKCNHYGKCWKGEQLDKDTWEPRTDHHAMEVLE